MVAAEGRSKQRAVPAWCCASRGDDPFSLPALKRDLELLLELAASLNGEPLPGREVR
jgi:hypothetical protein